MIDPPLPSPDPIRVRTSPIGAFLDAMRDQGGPELSDVTHVRSAHNASVFSGFVDGQAVFAKRYHTEAGVKIIQQMVADITEVRPRMTAPIGGVPDIMWADPAAGLVVMSAVPGTSMVDAFGAGSARTIVPALARWLRAFGASSLVEDRYATGHWVRKRQSQDLSALPADTAALVQTALDVQRDRWKTLGAVPVWKCRVPKDFGPHNFHVDGDKIWGFDLEGHRVQPVALGIVNFAVASERRLPDAKVGQFGLQDDVLVTLLDACADIAPANDVIAFMVCDCLIERVIKHFTGSQNGPAFRASLAAHLDSRQV